MQHRVASRSITTALASAVHEWFLIFLLLIDASFSYLITKFATYSRLQIPCILCSRIDHILRNEKAEFCWDLLCEKHKVKISSLVLCSLHQSLVDVHELCESCLFSFATVNKSNSETYRLLVGKLGDDLHRANPDFNDGRRQCSCCKELLVSNINDHLLFDKMSVEYESVELYKPLLATDEQDTVELKDITDVALSQNAGVFLGKDDVDLLPHVGYQKVNIASDTESKASLSDDESACSVANLTKFDQRDLNAADDTEKISLLDDLTSENLIHPAVVIEPESKVQVKNGILHDTESSEPIGYGVEELNPQHVEPESSICEHAEASQTISVSGTLTSSHADHQYAVDFSEGTVDVKKHVGESDKETVKNSETRTLTKIASLNERLIVFKPSSSDNTSQIPNMLELGDAYKLAIGSRGRQLSGKLLEQISLKDSAKLSDDLKFLLSQLSSARVNDLSSSDVSPRISGNITEYRTPDALNNFMGMQILQRRASLERNVSGISLDESVISEIEGESLVDRLKRQVEHDKKLMSSLYKELEDERNASTIAVNEAMAMITRLQEEKSAVQMEALQCLRMMEEQAEYDNENLQTVNDLLAEKEKETLDLEAELEYYKKKTSDSCPTDDKTDKNDPQEHEKGSCKQTKNKLLDFENETLYILQHLQTLERKLELFSNDETFEDIDTLNVDIEECDSRIDNVETQSGNNQLEDLRNEFSVLSDRLKALEAERNFLEQGINSLNKGDEGLKLILDIASQVRELHSIGFRKE